MKCGLTARFANSPGPANRGKATLVTSSPYLSLSLLTSPSSLSELRVSLSPADPLVVTDRLESTDLEEHLHDVLI